MSTKKTLSLVEKLADIQNRIKAPKSQFNSFGKYHYRKAEDILEGLKPLLTEHGVTVYTTEHLITDSSQPVVMCQAFITDGETEIKATSIVGVDLDQKGMQMPQRYGAASTYGKKYALGNLLLLDDTQDADATNTHGKGIAAAATPTRKKITKVQMGKAEEFVAQATDKADAVAKIKDKYILTKTESAKLEALITV